MIDIEDLETVKKCLNLCSKGDGKYCLICAYKKHNAKDVPPVCHLKLCADSLKTIENMEKIIEDQQERIDIMAADMPVWIDITKEPPTKDDRDILVISEGEVCFCTHYFTGNGRHEYETPDIFESFPIENITHWMRCPKPLKGADDNVNS